MSFTVTALRAWYSTQKRKLPSGFLTKSTGDPKGEQDGRIIWHSKSSFNYSAIKFYSAGDTLYNRQVGILASATKLI